MSAAITTLEPAGVDHDGGSVLDERFRQNNDLLHGLAEFVKKMLPLALQYPEAGVKVLLLQLSVMNLMNGDFYMPT